MRPVNLIPPEERRGDRAPLRKGAFAYVVVGGLMAALAAAVVLVLVGNQVEERKAEVTALEAQEAQARERAQSLGAYAQFASLSLARTATVTSLAQSRFDWERVMRELSLVLPDDIWLTSLGGTVAPGVALEGSDSSLREGSSGPALAMTGCGLSHEAVAAFLQDLKDIDGVTRVGISKSELGDAADPTAVASSGSEASGCQVREFVSEFDAVAVFDEVTVPELTAPAPAAPATGSSAAPAEVSDATAESDKVRNSLSEQRDDARTAANLIPGVAR